MKYVSEIFVRPRELSRQPARLNTILFNAYRRLICRVPRHQVFLPLRNLQYLAILTHDEILFVDSFGPYQQHKGSSGRCITFAWQFQNLGQRDDITSPMPYDLVRYTQNNEVGNNRLVTELSTAVQKIEKSRQNYQNRTANVITL